MNKSTHAKIKPTLLSILIGMLIWFFIPNPDNVDINTWRLFAIFIGTIIAIIGKALPIGAISIIAITIVSLTGVTKSLHNTESINDALSGFSNQLIWLIGISMMISVSLNKTGLGNRIGYYFISIFGKKTLGIAYSLILAETILAPVTPSNTARGGAIIHPIMISISESFQSNPKLKTENKIGKYLSLVNFNMNPITSAMFITATAPNPLIVNFISEKIDYPIKLTWSTWAISAIVPGIISLLIMPLIIYWMYPPEIKITNNAPSFAKKKLKELGPLCKKEKITLIVFIILLFLWSGIPGVILGKKFIINPTVSAFIGLSILLLTGVLSWNDILNTKSAWDTIIWFSTLVMLATFLGKLGLIDWFSKNIEITIHNLNLNWILSSLLLIIIYVYSHYFFASTTAHIIAMFSAFLNAGLSVGAHPMLFSMILGYSSSLMMSLTHYSTGTAPIIFSSGFTTLGEWWKTGFILSVINIFIWITIGPFWWKIIGYW